MLFGRSLHFATAESPGIFLDRLSAVVLPAKAIAPLRPVRVRDWISRHAGKRFVGSVNGARFKLALLQTPGAKFRVRGSIVVIVGKVEDLSIDVNLRPPLFVLLFLAVFTVVVSSTLALSFFGPMRGHPILLVLPLVLVLPFVVVGWLFSCEATLAEQALRQVLFGDGVGLGVRKGDA